MNKFTYYIWDACSILGSVFLFAIVTSYFFPTFAIVEDSKLYIIIIFIFMVIGRYFLDKQRKM